MLYYNLYIVHTKGTLITRAFLIVKLENQVIYIPVWGMLWTLKISLDPSAPVPPFWPWWIQHIFQSQPIPTYTTLVRDQIREHLSFNLQLATYLISNAIIICRLRLSSSTSWLSRLFSEKSAAFPSIPTYKPKFWKLTHPKSLKITSEMGPI